MTTHSDKNQNLSLSAPIDLESTGVNSHAFPINDTINLLHWLERHTKLVVLGGDLLVNDGEKIEFMHENWSFDQVGAPNAHEESIQKAISYLRSFQSNENIDHIVVDLVVK